MTRKPRHEPEQLKLFNISDGPEASKATSWVARHWPGHVFAGRQRVPASAALVQWAEATPELSKAARALLFTLAREASGDLSECKSNLLSLARSNAMSRNTCRRHLEKLLSAGLIMMKVWREPLSGGILGYEFRLIADVEDRAAAAADGFWSCRPQSEVADTSRNTRKPGSPA